MPPILPMPFAQPMPVPRTWMGEIVRPWQLVFLVVGLPGLLLAIIIGLTVREPIRMRSAGSKETIVPLREVLAFLHRERAVFLPHMLGFTCMAMALYALLGWSPAYLLRTFGASAADVGFRLGFAAVLAGAGGVLSSGWFMDWLSARGRHDSPFVTGMIGATGVIISVSALPFAQSLDSGTLLLGCALFFASFPMPPSTAVMQILAPPLMRSRVSAIFLFVNSLLGLTIGSLVVGLLNDHVFRSAGSVGLSIVVVASAASAGAVLLLQCARAPYARATQS